MSCSTILTAAEFNSIPSFEDQKGWHPPSHILHLIGRILVVAGQAPIWALGIFHRHIIIPPSTALVHSETHNKITRCEVHRLSDVPSASLQGHSFHLSKDKKWKAHEYSIGPKRQELDFEGLGKLTALFLQHNLADRLAIVPNTNVDEELVEFQLDDDTGMITIPRSMVDAIDIQESEAVTTGWAFSERDGVLQIRAVQKCQPQTSGYHKRVK